MTAWLKTIGTSTSPLRNDWGSHAPVLLRSASFAKPPGAGSFAPGDDFVYYALGNGKSRIVAIGRIVARPRFDRSGVEEEGWPWLVDIELHAKIDLISDGFPLQSLDVDRELSRSVRRHSHIRLRPEEFERARRLFGL